MNAQDEQTAMGLEGNGQTERWFHRHNAGTMHLLHSRQPWQSECLLDISGYVDATANELSLRPHKRCGKCVKALKARRGK